MKTVSSLALVWLNALVVGSPAVPSTPLDRPHLQVQETHTQPSTTAEQLFKQGNRLAQDGKLAAAIIAYRQSIAVDATNSQVYCQMAEVLVQLQRLEEALPAIRQALVLETRVTARSPVWYDAHARTQLAQILTQHQQVDAALPYRKQAIALYPEDETLYFGLGQTLVAKGDAEAAMMAYVQGYQQQIAANEISNGFKDLEAAYTDRNALAWRDVGNDFVALEQYQPAIRAYQKAIAIAPTGHFYYALASAQEQAGQQAAAAQSYAQAGASMPYQHLHIGIDAYREALRLQPDDANIHSGLGKALLEHGEIQAAIASFEQALSLNPNLTEAKDNIAKAKSRL
ncbi:tetratricopeptide repeat protein [Acaryochloris sp. CCMEE 5410]|uniref:tetratricopeptide repeat protein n=1 Tax=Acaryochloris sp. CCMEE 5410 TaxID=310037 RepID=UPI0003139B40|nr:tetratricopeptide repeat protein [Acaryochloris sp. CCMEE 5410]KAI9133910.1 tetratricopeptide repeat protein [Acaryochloris sp. CCMEE 5410]